MVNFEPIEVKGKTIRLHWLVSFLRGGQYYFMADSKRPGHLAGPYKSAEAFIEDYSRFRNRKILSFKELTTYLKNKKRSSKP